MRRVQAPSRSGVELPINHLGLLTEEVGPVTDQPPRAGGCALARPGQRLSHRLAEADGAPALAVRADQRDIEDEPLGPSLWLGQLVVRTKWLRHDPSVSGASASRIGREGEFASSARTI
jgi:hypothetical protein